MMKYENIFPNGCSQNPIKHHRWFGILDIQSLKTSLGQWGKTLATWAEHDSEPKVYQRCDRQGHRYYQVYDPTKGTSAKFASESEIRAWLEQRYYR